MSKTGSGLAHPTVSRRQIVQGGAIGLLGVSMQDVKRFRACADTSPVRPAKKVVYIFLPGGPPQHETFDPKPMATAEVRGEFTAIETAVPGMLFCEHLPLLAQQADRIALLRSVHHHSNDHIAGTTIMTSGDTRVPAMTPASKEPDTTDTPGVAALAGYFHVGSDQLPGSAVLPEYVGRGSGTGQIVPGQQGGRLGSQHDPWLVQAASRCLGWGPCPDCFDDGDDDAVFAFGLQHNHTAPGPVFFAETSLSFPGQSDQDRLARKLSLLDSLERRSFPHIAGPQAQALDRFRSQAASLVTSTRVQQALNVFAEKDEVQDRYGRNKFGWSMLLTRRLLEAGVNMVQVSLGRNGTWDLHRRAFPLLKDFLLPPMDLAVSAFLEDLQQRGLLDETLVVMCGEFGRTPRLSSPQERRPGRDHWGALQTILFAGGGVTGGNIVGASDRIGGHPHECPKTPEDVAATIFDALGIPRDAMYHDIKGRPHPVYLGDPVSELYA